MASISDALQVIREISSEDKQLVSELGYDVAAFIGNGAWGMGHGSLVGFAIGEQSNHILSDPMKYGQQSVTYNSIQLLGVISETSILTVGPVLSKCITGEDSRGMSLRIDFITKIMCGKNYDRVRASLRYIPYVRHETISILLWNSLTRVLSINSLTPFPLRPN